MSHFTVLVVAEDVESALQPFHEFECTGTDDQYVEEIQELEDYKMQYAEATRDMVKAPDGSLHDRFTPEGNYDPRWWKTIPRDPSEFLSKDRHELALPEGHEIVEAPVKDLQSFLEYVQSDTSRPVITLEERRTSDHKYGYIVVHNGEVQHVIRRTNPNKKWDWWVEGGRWPNKLILRSGGTANQARARDIDWQAMIDKYADKAAATYDAIKSVIAGREVTTWAAAYARFKAGEIAIEAARSLYNDQQVVKDLIDAKAIDIWDGAETLSGVMAMDRATYIKREGETNASTWALLHKGQWTERGEMGWFGMSSADEASTRDATCIYWDTVRSLSDELCTVVDCHI